MNEWSDIRTFLAVMRAGSAAGAARTLGLNQTTVSRQIARLEAALDLRLFEPGARGAKPTTSARTLLGEAEAMEAGARAFEARADEMRRHLSGVIRLTTMAGVPRHISGLLRDFRAHHPDVTFELDTDDRALSLEDGEADVAMRAAMQLTGDTLIARKLFDHPWGFYASERYLQQFGTPSTLAEMAGHRIVLYQSVVTDRLDCIKEAQARLPETAGSVRVTSVEAMEGLLLDGEGLGFLPRASGDMEPTLRLCLTEPWMFQRFWLVWSPQGDATPHIRAFVRFVSERMPEVMRNLPPEWSA